MRRGVGAEHPHQVVGLSALQTAVALVPARDRTNTQIQSHAYSHSQSYTQSHSHSQSLALAQANHVRAGIAQLFLDLRTSLGASCGQLAAHLGTYTGVIEALESGRFELLPHWPETARIVMAYTALARIDGRPVLSALSAVVQAPLQRDLVPRALLPQITPPQVSPQPDIETLAPQTYARQSYAHEPSEQPSDHADAAHRIARERSAPRMQAERLRVAGAAFATGAKRLPAGALRHARERPDRAFYAVSLPLAVVVLLLNTSVLQAAINHVPRPVSRMVQEARQYFQVQFAPVREGLRWIEVDDPRRRRGDKLRNAGQ